MEIQKWTSSNKKAYKLNRVCFLKIIRYKENREKEGVHMAVSKACISCLDVEATKIFKEELESATLSLDVIKRGKELLKKLTKDTKEK